jgi:hypothetical protein
MKKINTLVKFCDFVKFFLFINGSQNFGPLVILSCPQNMVYNKTQHPPQPHTVCMCCTFTLGWGKGRGQREGRGTIVHNYNSFVHVGNSSQAWLKIPTMSECISSLQSPLNTRVWCFFSSFLHDAGLNNKHP